MSHRVESDVLRWLGPALWIAYTAFLFAFAVTPVPGWVPDAHLYLLMAEALSPWHGPSSPAARYALEQSPFPPLFPLLIGLFGGGADAVVARALSCACLSGALLVFHAWLRARGFGAAGASLAVAVVAVAPLTLMQALEGMSEPLYLLLSLVALLAAERAGSDRGMARAGPLAVSALAAGLALTTRSAGVALVAALALFLLARGLPARWAPALAASALGPWGLWWSASRLRGFGGGYAGALQSRLASYAPDTLSALIRSVPDQLSALFVAWQSAFALHPGAVVRGLASAIGALALLGLARRLLRFDLPALYAALYLVVIALWPFPDHAARFLWPLLPLLLAFAAEAASLVCRHPAGRAALLALALLALLPSLAVVWSRFRAAQEFDAVAFTHTPRWYLADEEGARGDARMRAAFASAMRSVAELVGEDQCVYAVSPEELMSWSRRIARLPPPGMLGDADFAAQSRGCDWFLLAPITVFPYDRPYYPRERLGDRFDLVVLPGGDPASALARRREKLPPAAPAPAPERAR